MKLYVFPPSPRAIKVVALANYLGLNPEIHVLDYFKADQHDPKFAALNPNKRMPVLEDDGFVLWEANAILQYLAQKKPDSGLWPRDPKLQADVLRWLFWDIAHWEPAWGIIIDEKVKKVLLDSRNGGLRTYGRATTPGTPNPERIAEGELYTQELAALLSAHLNGQRWLSVAGLSIADFAIAASTHVGNGVGFQIANYPQIARWFAAVVELPGWRDATPLRPSRLLSARSPAAAAQRG